MQSTDSSPPLRTLVTVGRRAALLRGWTNLSQPVLLALALLSIPLAIAELWLLRPLPAGDETIVGLTSIAVWSAFLVDVVVRAVLLPSPLDLLRHDKSSLLIVALGIPAFELPIGGALRLARPVLRILAFGTEIVTEAKHVLTRHAVAFVLFLTLFTWWTAGTLVLLFELSGDSFDTLGDGLWWSAVTMATVGYGDLSPVTLGGRVVAVTTMIVGIGSFSVMTAKLFELFSRPHQRAEPPFSAAPSPGTPPLSPLDRSV